MLNSASFAKSVVGRMLSFFGAVMRLPLCFPDMIRIIVGVKDKKIAVVVIPIK